MSKFSGKCDLKDFIEICGGFEKFNGIKLYIGNFDNPLLYKNLKDLVSFYPYIIKSAGINNKNNEQSSIILSEKSWVDIEEEKYGYRPYFDEYRKLLKEELENFN